MLYKRSQNITAMTLSIKNRKTTYLYMIEALGFVGIKVLITLYENNGEMYIREVISKAKTGSSSIYRALSVLSDYNLIIYEEKFGRKFILLTKPGWEVAEHLYKADKIVEEEKRKKTESLT